MGFGWLRWLGGVGVGMLLELGDIFAENFVASVVNDKVRISRAGVLRRER